MYGLFNKKCIFFVFLSILNTMLLSGSPRTEVYAVVNNSGETIRITAQFKNGIDIFSKVSYYKNGEFIRTFQIFRPGSFLGENGILQPENWAPIIDFFKDNYIDIGILEKLLLVVGELIIYDSDDNIILTLDDITDELFTVRGDLDYPLSVHGYDLVITQEMIDSKR